MESIGKNTTVHAITCNQSIEVQYSQITPRCKVIFDPLNLTKNGYQVIPRDINKAAVAVRILQSVQPDFIMAIGDDRADEELFAYINKLNIPNIVTCTVGAKSSEALYFVNGVQSVLSILETLPH